MQKNVYYNNEIHLDLTSLPYTIGSELHRENDFIIVHENSDELKVTSSTILSIEIEVEKIKKSIKELEYNYSFEHFMRVQDSIKFLPQSEEKEELLSLLYIYKESNSVSNFKEKCEMEEQNEHNIREKRSILYICC